MKLINSLLFLVFATSSQAQDSLPPFCELIDLNGKVVSYERIAPDSASYTLMVFWKTNSTKCCDNLETLQSAWLSQLKQKGVNLIAICSCYDGNWMKVKPLVYAKEWDFEVFIDVNGDFKRNMGVISVPHTLLLDSKLNKVCSTNGWCPGNEDIICKKIVNYIDTAEKQPNKQISLELPVN